MSWWDRLTGFDKFALFLLAGTILLAVASMFVPRLSRILSRGAPQPLSMLAITIVALLLLFLLSGVK